MTSSPPGARTIAVLGAGVVGRTLATGWMRAGHHVLIGSREPASDRIRHTLGDLTGAAGGGTVRALTHAAAARSADLAVVAVPGDQVPALVGELGGALCGTITIDTTNDISPGATTLNALAPLRAAGAVVYRAFNTVGWEQLARPVFGAQRADMPYTGSPDQAELVESLIADIGFRPVALGDDQRAVDAVDALARLWFLLAFGRGHGRRIGFRILTEADDRA
jgi:8-hydroxy-5-deazaflavin:NADPH oxidoreductase